MFVDNLIILHVPIQITCTLGEEDVEILEIRNNRSGQVRSNPQGWKNLRDKSLQGGAGGLAVGWVDLDLECSTILLGQ